MSTADGQPMSTVGRQKARLCAKNKYTKQRKKVLTKRKSDVIMTSSEDDSGSGPKKSGNKFVTNREEFDTMKMNTYARPACPTCPANYNKGEQVEWKVGYELTGQPGERNNKPGADGGDVLGWQVKSPKASMAENDNCEGYIFGFADADFFFEMTKEEFEEFLSQFSYVDRDSKTGKAKIRIKNDSTKMRKWLIARA